MTYCKFSTVSGVPAQDALCTSCTDDSLLLCCAPYIYMSLGRGCRRSRCRRRFSLCRPSQRTPAPRPPKPQPHPLPGRSSCLQAGREQCLHGQGSCQANSIRSPFVWTLRSALGHRALAEMRARHFWRPAVGVVRFAAPPLEAGNFYICPLYLLAEAKSAHLQLSIGPVQHQSHVLNLLSA